MLFILILVLFIGTVFLLLQKQWRIYRMIEGVPGPTPLPFIGSVLELGSSCEDVLINFQKLVEKYGSVFRLSIGLQNMVVITEPKHIAKILTSADDYQKGDIYKIAVPLIGDGLVTSSGEKWARHKKLLSSAFSNKQLVKYVVVFNEVAHNLVDKLKEEVHQDFVDVTDPVFTCTLNAICKTVMRTDVAENTEYHSLATQLADMFMVRFMSPIKRIDFLFRFTGDYLKSQEYVKAVDVFMKNMIENRKREFKTKASNGGRSSILDEMFRLSDEDVLTDEDISDHVKTFIFAGSDTVGITLSFALYELAKHPTIQNKILEEVQCILGADLTVDVSYEELQSLKYTECVLKEILRMYSPGPFVTRLLPHAFDFDDFTLPANTLALIFLYGLHRSEKIYPNPEKFDPDRFLPENSRERPACSFIPFAAGARSCLGQKYAMLEAKLVLAQLVRNFEIFEHPGHKPALLLACTLKSGNGLPVVLKLR